MKKVSRFLFMSLFLFASCQEGSKQETAAGSPFKEDTRAKELLQGVWLDDDTEEVVLKVLGDTIYYAEATNAPVYFVIMKDSLYLKGTGFSNSFKIDKQTEEVFQFHSLSDDIIRLHRSIDNTDSHNFLMQEQPIPIYDEVVKKDSVVMYGGKRYRGYVYINPSKMKVPKTSYTSEGISVEKIFYDNIIHICVYEGANKFYAKDISKKDFTGLVPDDFLEKSILSDMDFLGADSEGFHYRATVCIPEGESCYLIELLINHKGKLLKKLSGV